MSQIRSVNTGPEIIVRKQLHAAGYRYRLHVKSLPGRPDIVLPRYRTVIFVHGCFWHRHEDCRNAATPRTRPAFWQEKFAKNIERDRLVSSLLIAAGWKVEVVWECEVANGRRVWELMGKLQPKTQ